ncbi:MAG TPA: hypothetical protein PKJ99_16090 [Thermoanaerobaculales bacterium]|nr:hypothetical protein [Thermoanaerobaculales bacterium]HPA82230.1 hypothetical protein [Thermoanaerobaculales bacterium]HQL29987.1 hypothetical protein [Thermoanaerobaculales bacterium]HQN96836.1 hypothetical protein [Thermoanaerobaculales bacterium]HQP44474.1 hypothetical protein [Thermoanaerobaculales bacterium]
MRLALTRTGILAVLIVTAAAVTAEAQGNWRPGDFGSARFRLGLFEPEGDSAYWDDTFSVFTGAAGDFQDLTIGLDYLWRTSARTGIQFGTSFYGGETTQAYLDYVDLDGWDISHVTSLDTWDVSAAYVVRFGDGGSAVIPYLGAGGGFIFWTLEEAGDFIDFASPDQEVYFGIYQAEGWTWEAFGLVGVDIPVGYSWSFFGEGRYRYADDELGDDFGGFGTLDLSGWELALGLAWNF